MTMSEKRAAYQRAYYRRHKAKVIERNRLYRQDPKKRVHIREWFKDYRQMVRKEMIAAYGGECSCCGESQQEFLTLEHLNHDGQAHRKKFSGMGYVFDLKRRGWPKDGYTILCANCNQATRLGVPCPHRLYRRKK